ncbi:hypothetical protein ACTWP5_27455 [Streptomyces sp. 4N509B]|uniref:hypothetical protein n=1 Tax=Streptomyces sp. 4N509B TaxID=3457413 RepID=UPI003FD1D323
MAAVQLDLFPEPERPAPPPPPPPTYWEHTGRAREWRPVTVTVRYGPGAGEQHPALPHVHTGRTSPRNVAIRRTDGSTDVVPVRTLRRKDPNR